MGEEVYYTKNDHKPMHHNMAKWSALFFSTFKKEPKFEKLQPDSSGKNPNIQRHHFESRSLKYFLLSINSI